MAITNEITFDRDEILISWNDKHSRGRGAINKEHLKTIRFEKYTYGLFKKVEGLRIVLQTSTREEPYMYTSKDIGEDMVKTYMGQLREYAKRNHVTVFDSTKD